MLKAHVDSYYWFIVIIIDYYHYKLKVLKAHVNSRKTLDKDSAIYIIYYFYLLID